MKIIQNGNRFDFSNVQATHDTLPVGNYLLQFDEVHNQYYLVRKETFVLPSRVYGDHSIVDRWLRSAEVNSEKNLGIILSGLKGSGKTITAQKFCLDSRKPVIMITDDYHGPTFVDFLTSPCLRNCIVFIDEFEKIYSDNQSTIDLLGLMDGNYPTNLIFLLTVNEYRINDYLINRLNRIKYRKHYEDLEEEIVDEVINDLLQNKEHAESIKVFFDRVNMCTFDLLINLIKDMNLFQEDALTVGKHLNLEVARKYYDIFEIMDDILIPCYGTNGTNGTPSDLKWDFERRHERENVSSFVEVDLSLDEWNMEVISRSQFIITNSKTKEKFKFVQPQRSLAF